MKNTINKSILSHNRISLKRFNFIYSSLAILVSYIMMHATMLEYLLCSLAMLGEMREILLQARISFSRST